jgi:hypothetical protein
MRLMLLVVGTGLVVGVVAGVMFVGALSSTSR